MAERTFEKSSRTCSHDTIIMIVTHVLGDAVRLFTLQKFQRRIRLHGNQTETSEERGQKYLRSTQTEYRSGSNLQTLISPERNITYKESPISFSPPCTLVLYPQRRGNFVLPSYRNTNYRLIYANTLEQNRFPGSIKYEITSPWLEKHEFPRGRNFSLTVSL